MLYAAIQKIRNTGRSSSISEDDITTMINVYREMSYWADRMVQALEQPSHSILASSVHFATDFLENIESVHSYSIKSNVQVSVLYVALDLVLIHQILMSCNKAQLVAPRSEKPGNIHISDIDSYSDPINGDENDNEKCNAVIQVVKELKYPPNGSPQFVRNIRIVMGGGMVWNCQIITIIVLGIILLAFFGFVASRCIR